jgi:glycosyltransferase involved in cell wall biosynthesis
LIRAGFVYPLGGDSWLGGVNYVRNLLLALTSSPECGVVPVLFAGRDTRIDAGFPEVETVRTSLAELPSRTPRWILRGALARALGADVLFERELRARGVQLLSHSGPLGRRARMPALAWLQDFQHRYLPEFFTAQEVAARDARFEATCRLSTLVFVSSEAALRDVEKYYPRWASKARVLRFVDCATSVGQGEDPAEVERRHQVSGPFVLLPNQFWAHKNHRAVLDALALLKARGQRVDVIATGNTQDHRAPGFFEALMRHRAERGVEDRFRVLGMVPFADLAALMRSAVAILNPSLFEGWSTTVEEAKSLGKTVLLSDIPVHREQAPERGLYFDPRDPERLADALWRAWTQRDAAEDAAAATRAAAALPARRRTFAEAYARIAREVVPSSPAARVEPS